MIGRSAARRPGPRRPAADGRRGRPSRRAALLAAIVESAGDAIIGVTPDGMIATWNAAAERLYGYSAAEAVGRPYAMLCPPGREAEIGGTLERLRLGAEVRRVEARRVRKDGRPIEVDVTWSPVRGAAGEVVAASVVARDVTERSGSEAALRESERRFRATFEQAAVGLAHLRPDGRWLRVNRRLCEILGYAGDELLRTTFREIAHPDDVAPDLEQLGHALVAETDSYRVEKRWLRKDGSAVWVDLTLSLVREADGSPGYFVAVVENVTARRIARATLQREYAFVRELIDTAHAAILVLDAAGRVLRYNGFFERLSGRPLRDAVGRDWFEEFLPARDRPAVRSLFEWALRRVPVRGEICPVVATGGGERKLAWYVSPLPESRGGGARLLCVGHDVTERLEAERAVRESEALARGVLASLSAQIAVLDTSGRITAVNPAWEEAAIRAGDLDLDRAGVGADYLAVCRRAADGGCADAARILEGVEAVLAGRRREFSLEYRCDLPSGRRWFLLRAMPLAHESGGAVVSNFDITDRRRSEEAVRESEERFRLLFERSLDAILVADDDGAFRLVNPAACALLGYPRDRLLTMALTDIGADGPEATRRRFERYKAGDEPTGEFRFLRADGQVRHAEFAATEITSGRHLAILRDVTDRKRMEAALRESERRLRAVLDTAADAIITIDDLGTVRSFNPAAERMFGYPAAEIVGENVSRLMPAAYGGGHDRYLARYRETGFRSVIGAVRELVGRRRDGSLFPIELAVSEVEPRRRFTGIIRDVSERKALQEQLLTIAEQEQRRIGQDLHDDVGQELTGLGLTADTLLEALEEYGLPEAALADRIVAAVRRTLQKVRQLSQGLVPVEVDAGGLMSALAELATRIETTDGTACSFECPRPVAVADNRVATQLYRIAQEAVTNAARHARARHVRVSLDADGPAVTLTVRDDGVGIDAAADGAGPHEAGSGLRIMRHRAGLIGAALSIGPADGGGTEVTCRLLEGGSDER